MTCKDCGIELQDTHPGIQGRRMTRCLGCAVKRTRRLQRELRLGLRKPRGKNDQGVVTKWEKRWKMQLQWWERPQYGPNESKTSPTQD